MSKTVAGHVLVGVLMLELLEPRNPEFFERCSFPDVPGALLNAAGVQLRFGESKECLDVDDASELEAALLQKLDVVLDAGLQLNISEIGANVFDRLRDIARVMEDENLSVGAAENDRNAARLTSIRLLKEWGLAVVLSVEA